MPCFFSRLAKDHRLISLGVQVRYSSQTHYHISLEMFVGLVGALRWTITCYKYIFLNGERTSGAGSLVRLERNQINKINKIQINDVVDTSMMALTVFFPSMRIRLRRKKRARRRILVSSVTHTSP